MIAALALIALSLVAAAWHPRILEDDTFWHE